MNEHQTLQKFKKELSHGFTLTAILSRCEIHLREHEEWAELFEFYLTLKEVRNEEN